MNQPHRYRAHPTPTCPPPDVTIPPSTGPETGTARPGWVEVLVGVAVFLVLSFGGIPLIKHLGLDAIVYGLIVSAWSGLAGLAGFAVARSLRVPASVAFNVRAASWRWLAAAVGVGVVVFLLVRLVTVLYTVVFGAAADVQAVYTETGAAGGVSLVLSLLFLAVLTPLGEELLFRGVVTTAFLRYGRAAGVLGSAVVFAAVHGPNAAAVTAVIVGVINAELLRRSRSVWPGVVVHAVNNALGIGLGVLLTAAS